ncbi:hypothetical protein M408DRAFT_333147 [Serendipita vermifera MAFF 305830]|uniref:Mitochondrial genome maintenance protein MGM101 n=1 Tax=Serendipita vermifera MAFF 305830 TaxID=933852 RepID=A0A0C2W658_SERVB|nr:hypothetical protein M408DRAFT_333147 [Serendipita vermifera MAFF 305830]
MASRTLLRVQAGAIRFTRQQGHIIRAFSPLEAPKARALYGTKASPPAKLQQRAVSTIPEDFDVDTDLPSPTTSRAAEPAPGNPFPESATLGVDVGGTDWSRSYHGLSTTPFDKEISDILLAPIDPDDVEMKPDGLIYLPEIKYRRILNRAFGPGGWGLAPRSETNVSARVVSREYALVCLGRLVAIARGEQEYFDPAGIATATEACKSNALMRCCKDLGIASELWDPRFIREFKQKYCVDVFVEHVTTKKKRKMWRRKDAKFEYPWKEC